MLEPRLRSGRHEGVAVRTKLPADDGLEPLPVYDDGVRIEPEPAAEPAHHASARELARDCVEAVREVLAERAEVRNNAPWVTTAAAAEPRTKPASFLTTFNRMIELQPTRLPGLPDWWRHNADDGRIRITRRLTLEQPQPARAGTWRTPGRLRSPFLLRSVRVELLLWPYLGNWTRMSLEPQRSVHAGKRYFKRGHRSLDRLTQRLIAELPGPVRTAS
jgi:hypothetical protein